MYFPVDILMFLNNFINRFLNKMVEFLFIFSLFLYNFFVY